MPRNGSTKIRKVHVQDVGGVHDFTLELAPGVNVLTGHNAAGKTSTLKAVSRLYGAETSLEPRDGAGSGSVTGDGVQLVVKRVVRSTGRADVALADVGPLADLIDGGGMKDPDARNRCRIRALLTLLRLPVSDEAISTLASDPEILDRALNRLADEPAEDILTAAEKVRLESHAVAREYESRAEQSAGTAAALRQQAEHALEQVGGEDGIASLSLIEAENAERDLVDRLAGARIAAQQRRELEARQQEIRESLGGDVPDPNRFTAKLAEHRAAVERHGADIDALVDELRAIEARISDARARLATERAQLADVEQQEQVERERAAAHQRHMRVLDQPVTGPTLDEVEELESQLAAAREVTRSARLSAEYARLLAQSKAADENARQNAERAEFVRALATTVQDRLGRLLAGTAAEGLTLHNGRLAVLGDDGELQDFESRQSDGQRILLSLRIAAKAYGEGGVLPLDGRLWTQLDPERQQEFARIAAGLGQTVITEAPTDGPLSVTHLSGDEDSLGGAA